MRNLLTDISGIAVGHATDLAVGTGATAIIFDQAAVASAVILGGAPGSRDTALLEPEMTQQRVNAFVFSGGSIYGLDAAGGVQAWLREQGRGQRLRDALIPIVPQAIIFDLLNGGNKDWGRFSPYRDLGWDAAASATHGAFALGTVGAGTGATTATVKGGLGSASVRMKEGYTVAALVAVNAVATTIGLIATDATLTKAQCKRLAIMANDGLARAILPAHAPGDGDTVFSAATGALPLADEFDLTLIGHAATLVFARAIARAVYEATALPYPPGLKSWKDRWS